MTTDLREKFFERIIITGSALLHHVQQTEPQLTDDRMVVCNRVMACIHSGVGGLIFLDAPGGIGKPFLINLIFTKVCPSGDVALAGASSGIAAELQGRRTA